MARGIGPYILIPRLPASGEIVYRIDIEWRPVKDIGEDRGLVHLLEVEPEAILRPGRKAISNSDGRIAWLSSQVRISAIAAAKSALGRRTSTMCTRLPVKCAVRFFAARSPSPCGKRQHAAFSYDPLSREWAGERLADS